MFINACILPFDMQADGWVNLLHQFSLGHIIWIMHPQHSSIRKSSAVFLRWKRRQTVECFVGASCDLILMQAHWNTLPIDNRLHAVLVFLFY